MSFTVANLQKLLNKIPKGKVTTYAEIAKAMGSPRASRAVGTLCGKNPDCDTYPCWKVVKSDGTVGQFAHGSADKIRRLQADGIPVKNGKVENLSAHKYSFSSFAVETAPSLLVNSE